MMSFFGNRAISTPPPKPRRRTRVLAGAQESRQSGLERTLHAGDSVATEPDRAGVELDGDLTVTAEALALTGDIRVSLQHAVPTHKRRHTPVAAPAHGILGNPVAWRERAHINVGASAPRIQAEHVDPRDADRVECRELPLSGASALTTSSLASWTVNHTGPTSMIAARLMSSVMTPSPSATAAS